MKLGLFGGVLIGGLLTMQLFESKEPGSTAPVAQDARTAANNWMVTLGGMASDGLHTVIPVAADAVNLAREEFPNVLGPPPATDGTAQHPDAAAP